MRTFAFASSLALLAGFGAPSVGADEPPAPVPAPAPKAPAPNTDELQAKVLRWIADLASDDFRTREAASKGLAESGEAAREALEAAAKTSDSLEVRWRAQQLLMKLGGKDEKPLGAPDAPEPRVRAGIREIWDTDTPDEFRKSLERFLRDFGPGGRSPFGPSPFGRRSLTPFGDVLRAGGYTLVVPLFGDGEYRLVLPAKGGLASPTEYTGESLDAIVAAHPELKDAAEVAELRKQLAERKKRGEMMQGFGTLRPGFGSSMTVEISRDGVQMTQDANGVVVKLEKRDADGNPVLDTEGKPVLEELRGATLEEIKAQHPELAKRLEGVGRIQMGFGAPRVFRGQDEQGLAPLPPQPPSVPQPAPAAVRFGLRLVAMDPVLALHLGLEEGHGVLVDAVEEGSQAAKIGVKRHDVIESIDGQPIVGWKSAVDTLRTKAKDLSSPLSLGIIRTGQRQTLSR